MSPLGGRGPYGDISRHLSSSGSPKAPITRQTKRRALLLIACTLAGLMIYFGCVSVGFAHVFFVYIGLAAVLTVSYVVYNRGFVLKGATPDALPDTIPYEQREAMIAEAAQRLQRSQWMLMLLIPTVVALLVDACYLFFLADAMEALGLSL